MLRINQLKLRPGHSREELEDKICRYLRIKPDSLLDYKIQKQSIDARKKPDIFYTYTVDVKVKQASRVSRKLKNKVQKATVSRYRIPSHGECALESRPVIIGSGPAGLFCAYILAQAGFCPLLLERGASVEQRYQDVEAFWKTGILNPDSNVQFGEGGAGTFSDGKLNTLVKDTQGRNRFVLETFTRHGAPERILYEQKPHIGTDILIEVVKSMRERIKELGGEIRFYSQMTDIRLEEKTHPGQLKLAGITINHKEQLDTGLIVLAIGHSARDTFQMLYEKQMDMQAKSFAVGVRIEHPQSMIDFCQYARPAKQTDTGKLPEETPGRKKEDDTLPAASYKLTAQLANGRGAYTFCMCPGGYVVNASSEEGRLAVNGMSYHARDGVNANSAVIVTVTPDDFNGQHPLAGVAFQRELEERAFSLGQGKVPVQCFQDFCENRITAALGEITPQIKGAYTLANVREIFPKILGDSLEEGIRLMDDKIHGFAREDAILSGVESRTSSPVKLIRDEQFQSNIEGIYPCGEGAGYAGGITSAAMDGMKTAEAIIQKYAPFRPEQT